MKRMKKSDGRAEKAIRLKVPCLQALALPEDVAAGEARVVLCGSRRALIENIAGVSELQVDIIRLRLRRGEISLGGCGLSLREARKDAVYVEGCIRRIELAGDDA